MTIYKYLYRIVEVIMMHYEYFINIHECVYNPLWTLGLEKVYPKTVYGNDNVLNDP